MATLSSSPLSAVAATHLSSWLGHLGVSPAAFDDTLGWLNPLWTVHRLHARVVHRRAETATATTFELQAGPGFHGLRAGHHVMVGVEIAGAFHRRAYSPRAVPGHPQRFAITVQRQAGGLVSNHLHDRIQVGHHVTVSAPDGAFTLPAATPPRLLLIGGGSGITPLMAMLQHLHREAPATRVTLIYFARSRAERIFAEVLDDLARQWPAFRYVPVDSTAHTAAGGREPAAAPALLDEALLSRVAPDWARTPTWCCGPAPLMAAARTLWQQAGQAGQLHLEAFGPVRAEGGATTRHAVHIRRAPHTHRFEAPGHTTLLEASEQAGLRLKHGCRQGLCHECTCRLHSGAVRDLHSGSRIDGEGQAIRLCVSSALTDLQLESLG